MIAELTFLHIALQNVVAQGQTEGVLVGHQPTRPHILCVHSLDISEIIVHYLMNYVGIITIKLKTPSGVCVNTIRLKTPSGRRVMTSCHNKCLDSLWCICYHKLSQKFRLPLV